MSKLDRFFRAFPAQLALISAAGAAVSKFLSPRVILPNNLEQLGDFGSVVIAIVLLVVWVFRDPIRRRRVWVFTLTVRSR